jgi:hypothetical protein
MLPPRHGNGQSTDRQDRENQLVENDSLEWRAPFKGGVFPAGERPARLIAPAGSNRSSHRGNEMADRAGKARKRGNQDELAKPLVGVQLVQVQPGQSRSGQVGSECCHSPGEWRVRPLPGHGRPAAAPQNLSGMKRRPLSDASSSYLSFRLRRPSFTSSSCGSL